MFGTIILFILMLSVLVLVHEFGHFWTAKKMGMRVEEFGVGFPPRIWSVKRGETRYSINILPLGGFVRIKGESGDELHDPRSFAAKPIWQRFAVLVAGVAMNLVLAAVLLGVGFMIGIPSIIDTNTPQYTQVSEESLRVMTVIEGSPAERAGVVPGDHLLSIDDQVFLDAEAARATITESATDGVALTLRHDDGNAYDVNLSAETLEEIDFQGVGIGIIATGTVKYSPFVAVYRGVIETGVVTWEVVKAFADLFKNLVAEQRVSVDLSGPVGIAVLTGQVAEQGIVQFIQFTALLSINLAVINVLPFPALDGGRVLFVIIEKLRGAPVNQRIEAIVHNLGFAFLMALVLLVTYRDIVKFGDQILGTLRGAIGV